MVTFSVSEDVSLLTKQGRICPGGGQDLLPAISPSPASGRWQALASPWKVGCELLPFHRDAASSISTLLFILTHGHNSVSASPACSSPVLCSDLWIHLASKNELCYLQNKKTQQERDKIPKMAQYCDSDKLGSEKSFPGIKTNEFFRCIQNKGGC